MNIDQRIKAFVTLGLFLKNLEKDEFQSLAEGAANQNPWFTPYSIELSLKGLEEFLSETLLKKWVEQYKPAREKNIAIVMAGNIPLVGFHDLLCVLISGHSALLKLSSKDEYLMKFVIRKLVEFEPGFQNKINVVERLKNFDAVIATGSDNSSRYFEYYFGKYPHIIRKNRTSVGVLTGSEIDAELQLLGKDVFDFFGLGCRNISKIYVPENYSFPHLLDHWTSFGEIINHHKYCNNYDYQKSILLINNVHHFDNGFALVQKSDRLVSPISVLFYEEYIDEKNLEEKLKAVEEKIQVVAGTTSFASVSFGETQRPSLHDYADNVDTMKFLSEL